MKAWDAGHIYSLQSLDGGDHELLCFVKREGPGFPGNKGSHPGTIIQEVLRAIIDRLHYVNYQIPDRRNKLCVSCLRVVIWLLEDRAAERRGRSLNAAVEDIETVPTCPKCGHIQCGGH